MITATAIGRTTAEPKLAYTKAMVPRSYAQFTIASDNRDQSTTFLRVTVWGPLAETVAEHVTRGAT